MASLDMNYVGGVQEKCAKMGLPNPVYEVCGSGFNGCK